MTRLPRVDSACRLFPEIAATSHRSARLAQAAIAIGLGLTLSCSAALAQSPAKGSPEHIKAVTSAVDGASIKANTATSNDWPTIGLDYAETRFSKLNQINVDNVTKLGLVWSYPLNPPAASRRRRTWSTASCTRPHHGAWCMPSTPAPASGCGPSIPRSTARRATRAAATWSIAASHSGRARFLSAPMTAGCSRSMPPPARWSGKKTPSSARNTPTPSPARRACSTARW